MLTDPEEIIIRIKKGDKNAFRQVVDEYNRQAFSLAFRLLCDEEEARDIVQDSFIKAWQKIGTYDMSFKFSTWLFRIVANSAIDRLRQIKRHKQVKLEDVIRKIDKLSPDTTQSDLDNKETAQLIRWFADGLPEKQRKVFILRDLQGMEASEVQLIMDMSENSVKSNLYHARNEIRKKLSKALK